MRKITRKCLVLYISFFMFACLLVNVILLTDLLASVEDGDETDDEDNIGNYDYHLQTRWTPRMDLFCSKVTQRVEDEHHEEEAAVPV